MSCNTPHPSNAIPRNATTSCFWHATGNLVCNTNTPPPPQAAYNTADPFSEIDHLTSPFVLSNATQAVPFAHPTTEAFVDSDATPTYSHIVPAVPYAEFASFGQPNANYTPTAYKQHMDWYTTHNQPRCNVPCKSCQTSGPSFRSPPRSVDKERPPELPYGGQ